MQWIVYNSIRRMRERLLIALTMEQEKIAVMVGLAPQPDFVEKQTRGMPHTRESQSLAFRKPIQEYP